MRNKFEKAVSKLLGPSYEYEAITLPYTIKHSYTPDFIDRDRKVMVEAKGRLTPEMRRKYIAVKQQNPNWELIFIFQNPNRTISKTSKTTYKEWAIQHGFRVR